MVEFFRALSTFPFLQHALIAGLLASVASGVVGTFVVTRRITVIAGSLAHSVLGGMGVNRSSMKRRPEMGEYVIVGRST